jgi:membrane-associated phospholipid phosphatase
MLLQELALAAFWYVRQPVIAASVFLSDAAAFAASSAALLVVVSWLSSEQRRIPFTLTAVAIALLLGLSLKPFLHEERPCVLVPGKVSCPLDFSLPSIHALVAFTIAIAAVGGSSFPIYLSYALFVAFSRVYLGVHTITEVAAGLSLAFLACVLAEMLWRRAGRELPPEVRMRHEMGALG